MQEFLKHFSAEINLNLPACFKGDLLRYIEKLNKYRFRNESYSLVSILIAEYLTEAYMKASFSGQLKCPSQLRGIVYLGIFIFLTTPELRKRL